MIHALPGMGADHRMYAPVWSSVPNFIAHDWVRHRGERSLAEVAESMCSTCSIQDGDALIGASLGGMVACEITKIRRIPVVYLVGSAVRKEEVNHLLSLLHPLARIAPIHWMQALSGKVPMELFQIFSDAEASFVRSMCEAVFNWDGLGETNCRIVRIHGRKDLVIPPPETADLFLDGGHLISITHAMECSEFIRRDQASVPVD
jgi:pimeloyl-ACP methyl ester carboxylesterase